MTAVGPKPSEGQAQHDPAQFCKSCPSIGACTMHGCLEPRRQAPPEPPDLSISSEGQALKLSFTGMTEAGIDPARAWQIIVDDCRDPLVMAMFDDLNSDDEGRAALAALAGQWRKLGLRPPWEAPD